MGMKENNFDFTKKDICWTTSPLSEDALKEVPFVEIRGYRQDWSAVIGNINAWFKRAVNAAARVNNPYEGLYIGTPMVQYKLPYLSDYHHTISQGWAEANGGMGEVAGEVLAAIKTAANAILPAVGVVKPQSYSGPSESSYTIPLSLINTYEINGRNGGKSNITKNKEFLQSIIKYSLHKQNNALSIEPPLIYEVFIPGIRWSPAAVISSLNVTNIGSLNTADSFGLTGQDTPPNYIFPDAWRLDITFKELINESRNLYEEAIKMQRDIDSISVRTFKSR